MSYRPLIQYTSVDSSLSTRDVIFDTKYLMIEIFFDYFVMEYCNILITTSPYVYIKNIKIHTWKTHPISKLQNLNDANPLCTKLLRLYLDEYFD